MYIELSKQRLRQFDEWTFNNPPEAGVVRVTRDPHGRFGQGVALRAAADAAVARVGGRA